MRFTTLPSCLVCRVFPSAFSVRHGAPSRDASKSSDKVYTTCMHSRACLTLLRSACHFPPSSRRSDGQWQDCTSCGISGVPITSSLYLDDAEFEIGDGVQYIIVVEKEGIFSRLTEDKLWERLPCVIVTGKGFPDAATRWFVSNLSRQTNITAIALCDWNPFGLSIYLTYVRRVFVPAAFAPSVACPELTPESCPSVLAL